MCRRQKSKKSLLLGQKLSRKEGSYRQFRINQNVADRVLFLVKAKANFVQSYLLFSPTNLSIQSDMRKVVEERIQP